MKTPCVKLSIDVFLSTLSLRRATLWKLRNPIRPGNFYPRSPCGERPHPVGVLVTVIEISIHALLAESDVGASQGADIEHNFYPRSPCGERHTPGALPETPYCISIHALLAESDAGVNSMLTLIQNFYPRSPCGERLFLLRKITITVDISIHALLAESDPRNWRKPHERKTFLSTLSLRRATSTDR